MIGIYIMLGGIALFVGLITALDVLSRRRHKAQKQ